MRALHRAVKTRIDGGAVLPPVFNTFVKRGINIRRAEVSMIAGPPGAGKSALALTLALKSGAGCLYFSADTHPHTMSLRVMSMILDKPQEDVEQYMDSDPDWASGILKSADHIRWCFDSSPDLRTIEEEIQVYREVVGENPHLIVIDNAIDVTHDSGDEYSSLRSLMRELKWWSRDTEAAVIVLHHTSEGIPGNPCPPMKSLHGKVAQTPALVLTVQSSDGIMGVAGVKNRYGASRADGSDPVWLSFDPARMHLSDVDQV